MTHQTQVQTPVLIQVQAILVTLTARNSGFDLNEFIKIDVQDPDGEIENSGKSIFEIRIPNFCYIQVIVFDLGYLPVAAVGTQQVRYHEKIAKNIF